jgi:hypothetical protein
MAVGVPVASRTAPPQKLDEASQAALNAKVKDSPHNTERSFYILQFNDRNA